MKNPSYFIQGEVYWAWNNNPLNCAAGRCFRPWICDSGGRREEQEISTFSFRLRGGYRDFVAVSIREVAVVSSRLSSIYSRMRKLPVSVDF
jgi:hypothetical protein